MLIVVSGARRVNARPSSWKLRRAVVGLAGGMLFVVVALQAA